MFLDADVTLTPAWEQTIGSALQPILRGEALVTGSHCLPTDAENVLERHWFRAISTRPRSTYVGSAHLIVGHACFEAIGGFDAQLVTGEDYEFCKRARTLGCRVEGDPRLAVIHHGFPKRFSDFMRREAWHGVGDLSSVSAFLTSRVALATAFFIGIHAALVLCLVLGEWISATELALALGAFLMLSSLAKFNHAGPSAITVNALIFYLYFLGRSYGIVQFLLGSRRPTSPRT